MMTCKCSNSPLGVLLSVLVLLLSLLRCTQCASETTSEAVPAQRQQLWIQHSRDFGVSSYIFSGEWGGRPYQATIHARAVCQHNIKHMRLVVIIAPAPHPYYKWGRLYEFPVTPTDWFTPDENGMPKIWFQEYKTGANVTVKQHVDEREVDGTWFFEDPWIPVCWLATANLKPETAYTLNIEGSERSYQAVPSGPCQPAHPIFQAQLPKLGNASPAWPVSGNSATSHNNDAPHTATDVDKPMVWIAPVQKVVFAKSHMAYIVRQHLEYHIRLGMAGTLMTCDYFVCLELMQDPSLARRVEEGRLVLWMWEHGNEYDKPHHKLYMANNLLRLAGYGTPALFLFQDLDEFLVIPSGKPLQQLLAPGGCLSGVRKRAQATIRSKVTKAANWTNSDPKSPGELPEWLAHELWVDAVEKMNYSMAPQVFCGWKSLVDPNFNYSFLCHDHFDRVGMMDGGKWSNYVDDSCAYNMHFTNWFSNRFASHTVGGAVGDFVPLNKSHLARLRSVYQSGVENSVWSLPGTSHGTEAAVYTAVGSGQTSKTSQYLNVNATNQCSSCPVQHAVKTISVTLVTRNSEILVGDALRSVGSWVDACLVVYTSNVESPWLTLAAAADAVGDKLVTYEIPSAGLGHMLNVSLSRAMQLGAEWAVLIGPDEKVVDDTNNGMQQALDNAMKSGAAQHNCYHKSLNYSQAFLVQLSDGGGFVHNQYVQPPGQQESTLQGCTITRPTKTNPWTQRRARESIKAVREDHTSMAIPQAAWFALAEAHWALGERQDAQSAWQQCSELQQSHELGALCAYRLAVLAHIGTQAHHEAFKVVENAIYMHGQSPELCWLAAYTAYHTGHHERSKEWALQAVQIGCYRGSCMSQGRIPIVTGAHFGFPFDVLQFALLELGDAAGAELAQQQTKIANAASQGVPARTVGVTAAVAVA